MPRSTPNNFERRFFQGPETRQSYRVPCRLAVFYRLISPDAWPVRWQCGSENSWNTASLTIAAFLYGVRDRGFDILPQPAGLEGFPSPGRDRCGFRSQVEGNIFIGLALDLSGDGLRLQGQKPLVAGQGLDLAVSLPSAPHQMQEILAQVIWTDPEDPGKAGIKFINLSRSDRELLISYVFFRQRQLLRKRKAD